MSKNCKAMWFQKEYPMLDTRFKKADEEMFNLGILIAYTSELDNGFMVKKQLKTTSRGTKFNYKRIESQEEANDYCSKVKEMYNKIDPDLIARKVASKIREIEKESI